MDGILYLLLIASLHEKVIKRWINLTKCLFKEMVEEKGDESINNLPNKKREHEQVLKNQYKDSKLYGGIDAIRPNQSFMEKNKLEAQTLFERKNAIISEMSINIVYVNYLSSLNCNNIIYFICSLYQLIYISFSLINSFNL